MADKLYLEHSANTTTSYIIVCMEQIPDYLLIGGFFLIPHEYFFHYILALCVNNGLYFSCLFLVWTSPWPIFFLESLVVSMGSPISSCCQCGLSSWIRCPINGTCLGHVCINIFGHLHSKFGKNFMSSPVVSSNSWGLFWKKYEFSIRIFRAF